MNQIISLLLMLLTVSTYAQTKYGNVSIEELKQSKSSIDENAPAEIISETGSYEVEYVPHSDKYKTTKEVQIRVKIYDKEKAPKYLMKVAIPAYKSGSEKEKIYNIKATTYNLINGKVEKSKVSSKNIYTEDVNEYVEVEKLAFPNVKDGSVLEYKYTITTPRFFDLGTWYFQQEIPVKYSQLRVSYPNFFVYQKDRRGDLSARIKTKSRFSSGIGKSKMDILTYKNVPPLKKEPFVQNLNNLKTSIRYELSLYNNTGHGYKDFTSSWDKIAKSLNLSSEYGDELRGNKFLNDDVAQFKSIKDKEQRLEAIFEFVQQKYNWNQYLNLYPDKGTRKTYKEKTGNGTDINFILIAMLRKAGFEANPVVLSTVNNGLLNYFPSKQKLNHTISGVVLNKTIYLMDPIVKFSKVNLLPQQDLNMQGYMITEDGKSQSVDLVNHIVSKNSRQLHYELVDGVLSGKYINTRTNYFAMTDLSMQKSNQIDFEEDYLSNVDAEITNFDHKANLTNDAIRYSLNFEDEKNYEEIGNKLLLKPLLFTTLDANAFNFSNKERKYPLEFGTPFTNLTTAKFTIPDGYELESMPENRQILLDQNVGGYNISFTQKGNQIIVQSLLHIAYSILPQSFYEPIRNMFAQIVEMENQQIVLQQK